MHETLSHHPESPHCPPTLAVPQSFVASLSCIRTKAKKASRACKGRYVSAYECTLCSAEIRENHTKRSSLYRRLRP